MSLPTEASATILAREAPIAFLVELAFVSATKRVWTGFGRLRTSDAREWDGLGEVISIDGLGGALSGTAPAGKLSVSGVSEAVLDKAIGEVAEFKDRAVAFYLQPFADRALYGAPVPYGLRIMKNMEVTRSAGIRTIAINHEGPYAGRRRPAAGWYSDRDQQKRFAGDLACQRTAFLLYQQEIWPKF